MRLTRLRRTVSTLTALVGLVAATEARADYLLAPGDVLELTALGVPELKQDATIDVNGHASFPVLGQVKAAGLSLGQLRDQLRELVPSKVFRRRTQEGREYPVVVSPDEVNVDVAQYRPVYVDGDVARPGAQTFRPGLTVRQVIALAGGYDVMRFRGRDPFLESADFRAEYYTLWTDFAKEESRIARLKSELAGNGELPKQGRAESPILPSVLTRITDLEAKQLEAEIADHRDQQAHLRDAIEQEQRRISILSQTEVQEKQGADAEARDLEEMKRNFAKGVIQANRMSEMRRMSLLSSTQALQTTAMLATVERQQGELKRALRQSDNQWRIDRTRELLEAQVRLENIRVRIQSVGEKLEYAGLVRSQLVRGRGGSPDIHVFRQPRSGEKGLQADEDTELMPGDVVEVALRIEAAGMPSAGR